MRIAGEAGLILAAALLLSAAASGIRPEAQKLTWIGAGKIAPQKEARPASEAGKGIAPQPGSSGALFTEITAEVAHRMHGAGIPFLDARRTAAYEAGHIAGARSIPVWEHDADARIDALRRDGVPFEKDIVVYCSGPSCEDSERLAEKLALAGYYKLSLYREGFPDWEKRGWPVRRGAEP